MSMLDANGAVACAECGRQARAVRDRLKAENESLRELVRDIWDAYRCEEVAPNVAKHWHDRMRELGVVE